jgi:hypothetical protein
MAGKSDAYRKHPVSFAPAHSSCLCLIKPMPEYRIAGKQHGFS